MLETMHSLYIALIYLTELRSMVQKAWAWAKANNRVRTNQIHGEEEIYIIASETFNLNATDLEEREQSGHITVEERAKFGIAYMKHAHRCALMSLPCLHVSLCRTLMAACLTLTFPISMPPPLTCWQGLQASLRGTPIIVSSAARLG